MHSTILHILLRQIRVRSRFSRMVCTMHTCNWRITNAHASTTTACNDSYTMLVSTKIKKVKHNFNYGKSLIYKQLHVGVNISMGAFLVITMVGMCTGIKPVCGATGAQWTTIPDLSSCTWQILNYICAAVHNAVKIGTFHSNRQWKPPASVATEINKLIQTHFVQLFYFSS